MKRSIYWESHLYFSYTHLCLKLNACGPPCLKLKSLITRHSSTLLLVLITEEVLWEVRIYRLSCFLVIFFPDGFFILIKWFMFLNVQVINSTLEKKKKYCGAGYRYSRTEPLCLLCTSKGCSFGLHVLAYKYRIHYY